MGNRFSAGELASLYLSNGSTDTFCDVIALAGSAMAQTVWQQNLVLHFCDLARYSRGFGGFDFGELPWTSHWQQERKFFAEVLHRASRRTGWDKLHYAPSIDRSLDAFAGMLTALPTGATLSSRLGDWTVAPRQHLLDMCVRHGVFQGESGCRLCDTWIQPSDAPTVWELTSTRTASGTITSREIRQIPDLLVPQILTAVGIPERDNTAIQIKPADLENVSNIVGLTLDHRAGHWLGKAVA